MAHELENSQSSEYPGKVPPAGTWKEEITVVAPTRNTAGSVVQTAPLNPPEQSQEQKALTRVRGMLTNVGKAQSLDVLMSMGFSGLGLYRYGQAFERMPPGIENSLEYVNARRQLTVKRVVLYPVMAAILAGIVLPILLSIGLDNNYLLWGLIPGAIAVLTTIMFRAFRWRDVPQAEWVWYREEFLRYTEQHPLPLEVIEFTTVVADKVIAPQNEYTPGIRFVVSHPMRYSARVDTNHVAEYRRDIGILTAEDWKRREGRLYVDKRLVLARWGFTPATDH